MAAKGRMDQSAGAKNPNALPPEYYKTRKSEGWARRTTNVNPWHEGLEVEGAFVRLVPPRNPDSSPVLIINTDSGMERYWCPTLLESALEGIAEGTELLIVCLGQTREIKKRTTLAWDFEVFTK